MRSVNAHQHMYFAICRLRGACSVENSLPDAGESERQYISRNELREKRPPQRWLGGQRRRAAGRHYARQNKSQ